MSISVFVGRDSPISNFELIVYPTIDNKEIAIRGRIVRVAKLRAEYYEYISESEEFVRSVADSRIGADIFSFIDPPSTTLERGGYCHTSQKIAILNIETYNRWWTNQINDKTRNMVRKAGKKGVIVEVCGFDDNFARGIHSIYNETPLIQGRPSRHYGKDFETLKKAHMTFIDRSVFIAAHFEGILIGFVKMVVLQNCGSIMQINSLISHRDKAPTNALLAKAVEVCEARDIRLLQYGIWSRRTLGAFKMHHGFQLKEIPRYFAPLNWFGRVALKLGLQRDLSELLPGTWLDSFVGFRTRWYLSKYRKQIHKARDRRLATFSKHK